MKIFTFLASLLLIQLANSQTNVPEIINSNTSWTKAGSPYLITKNLTIESNAVLTIEPGAVVTLSPSRTIAVYGSIISEGTAEDSIVFQCSEAGKSWYVINFYGEKANFTYTNIKSATRFINANHGTIKIEDCTIQSTTKGNGDDCIAVHSSPRVYLNRIKLTGAGGTIAGGSKNDAIDLDEVDSCFIQNSVISNFSDDGIDIGTQSKYAYIAHNTIFKTNFGITIGEESTGFVYRNICYQNDAGLQVHNDANVIAKNNLLYANTDGIECYHSEQGESVQSGGKLQVSNTIFYKNTRYNFRVQTSSDLKIAYSISDKDTLPGEHNLKADAILKDPENANFSLQSGSPCIDAGETDSLEVFIGNNTDLGPLEFNGEVVVKIDKSADFQIFPNPSKELIHYILKDNFEPRSLVIYGLNGQVKLQRNLYSNVGSIDIKGLSAGMYIISVEGKQSKFTQQLIIQE